MGKRFPFVAVIEYQERGAVHIHAAVSGFQDLRLLRSLWHRLVGGSERGNIDVQYSGGQRPRPATYLAKYLAKDLPEDGKGMHHYKRSRGITVPSGILLWPHDVALDAELISQFEARGATVRFHKNRLAQEGPKWLWASSW